MKKLLLCSVIAVAPFVAMAQVPGVSNTASTSATSTAGVNSTQGTIAGARVGGNGGVLVGAISGNTTSVQTSALGIAGPAGSSTLTNASQYNVGGTVSGGFAVNAAGKKGPLPTTGSSGFASGGQTSTASGSATASAANTNVTSPAKPTHGGLR